MSLPMEYRRFHRLHRGKNIPQSPHDAESIQGRSTSSPEKSPRSKVNAMIRPGRKSDANFIRRLTVEVFNIYGPYEEVVPKWFNLDTTVTLISTLNKKPVGVFGMLQSGLWATEVPDHFFAVLKYDDDLICQIEASNNCRIALPRWYLIGTKGTLIVPADLSNVWDRAEINYQKDDGKKEVMEINFIGHPGGGLEPGFYSALVKYENGDKNAMVSMYDSLAGMKIIDMIKESSEESKYIKF